MNVKTYSRGLDHHPRIPTRFQNFPYVALFVSNFPTHLNPLHFSNLPTNPPYLRDLHKTTDLLFKLKKLATYTCSVTLLLSLMENRIFKSAPMCCTPQISSFFRDFQVFLVLSRVCGKVWWHIMVSSCDCSFFAADFRRKIYMEFVQLCL